MNALLSFRDVELYYDHVYALKGVTLEVHAGETVALIGANGAGKTSILRAITGLKRVRSGEIEFEGRRIDGLAPDEIVKLGIAMVPEGRRVFPYMSVKDNLLMGAFTRSDKAEIGRTLEMVLARFPRLKERYSQAAGTMSGGEQQMLVISRALMAAASSARRALARHRAEAGAGYRPLDRRHQSRREGERAARRAELPNGAAHFPARLRADDRLGRAVGSLLRAAQ
jgi:ABC-type sugar transport system ATPase subunit